MLNVFIGYDHRQPIAYSVAQFSLIANCSKPVTVSPLKLETLPITKQGLTPFTFSRWLAPWLMDYQGWALFLDADTLVLGDVADVFEKADNSKAVLVSKNPQRFEWPSVMLLNCAHEANKVLTPEYIEGGGKVFKWDWLGGQDSDLIGDLPREWNHLVGYSEPRPDAKLVHFTAGIPPFEETRMCEYSKEWHEYAQHMASAMPWLTLMGNSVHARALLDGRIVPLGTPGARVLPIVHPDVIAAERGEAADAPAVNFAPLKGLV